MNVKFQLAALAVLVSMAGLSLVHAADPLTAVQLDQLMIQAQKICPVSGGPLGSMGAPLKAVSGERTIFLCCKNCVGKPIPTANWSKVIANLAKAQATCPVTGKPLPEKSVEVVVGKRMVFVCCEDCPAQVKADPDKFIAIVNHNLETNLKKPAGAVR